MTTTLPSAFKSPEGQAEFMAAYEATLKLWPVPYEPMDITGRYGRTHLVASGPKDAPTLVLLHMFFNFEGELVPQANHEMTISKHEYVDQRLLELLNRRA